MFFQLLHLGLKTFIHSFFHSKDMIPSQGLGMMVDAEQYENDSDLGSISRR